MTSIKGALIEYSDNFMGPLPNVLLFNINPNSLSRSISRERSTGEKDEEIHDVGKNPVETISFEFSFDASDGMNYASSPSHILGISPELAALEKMIHPSNVYDQMIGSAIGSVMDKIGNQLPSVFSNFAVKIPRDKYPRILFIWGPFRVLPVIIDTISIQEMKFNEALTPIKADIDISLEVQPLSSIKDDDIAKGALMYTTAIKEGHAISQMKNIPSYLGETGLL